MNHTQTKPAPACTCDGTICDVDHKRFRCASCLRVVPWCFGASDERDEALCDDCAALERTAREAASAVQVPVDTLPTLWRLCREYAARAAILALKGRKRDADAVAYFCGAIETLRLVGRDAEAATAERFTGLLLATRGYEVIEDQLLRADLAARGAK